MTSRAECWQAKPASTHAIADEPRAAAPRRPRCGPAAAALAALLAVTALGASPFEDAADPAGVARLRDARLLRFSSADPGGLNLDGSNFLRREGDLAVLAEADGPGAVVRLWATTEQSSQGDRFDGEILFFFDGATAPSLTLGLGDLFGGHAPFVPPLADYWAGGHFSYVPMPFARSITIAVRGVEEKFYYQVDVARYPDATPVTTFHLPLGGRDAAALARLAARWAAPAVDPPRAADEGLASAAADVPPGGAAELLALDGAGTITMLDVSIHPEDRATLQAARLLVTWDGAETPQIDVPVWDFFGLALEGEVGFIAYDTVPLSVRRGRYRTRLPMPYAAGARLRVENRGGAPLAAIATARYGACGGPQMGRLHAVFNAQSPTVDGEAYPIVEVAGRGQLAGLLLSVSDCVNLECLEGDERFTL
ncbi:MAG TPA: DUF2961 domain-containing protein, partial [Polyangia bacterium]